MRRPWQGVVLVLSAVGLVWTAGGAARAQWHWEPKRGWTDDASARARTETVAESAPPAFLPRYREVVEDAPAGTPAGDYYLAYLLYEADEFRQAARRFRRLAEAHEQTPAWAARAMFMRGECLYQNEDFYEAFQAFDTMLTKYPGGHNYRLALQREFEIAQVFLRGRRRRVLGIPLLDGPKTALEVLERIRAQDPRGPLADISRAITADYYYRRQAYEDAELHYDLLAQDHPHSPFVPQAIFRTACGRLFRQNGTDYDEGLLRQAAAGFERFLRQYPQAEEAGQAEMYLRRTQGLLARIALDTGRFYLKRGRQQAADVYFRRVLTDYPDTAAAAEANRLLAGGQPPALGGVAPAEE